MPELTCPVRPWSLALIALALLAACGGGRDVMQGPISPLRNPATPIYSAAGFDARAILGTWQQAALSGAAGVCPARGALRVSGEGVGGLRLDGQLCLDGRMVALDAPLRVVGPGRLAVQGMADWWVLWADHGYRTLAVGTPSGAFGFVLDRGALPQDRLTAAREIFEFNGYRAADLRPL